MLDARGRAFTPSQPRPNTVTMAKRKTKSRKPAKTAKKTRVKTEKPAVEEAAPQQEHALPVRIDASAAPAGKAKPRRKPAPGERHDGGLSTRWVIHFKGEDKPTPAHSVRAMCKVLAEHDILIKNEALRGFLRRCKDARGPKALKQQHRSFRPLLYPVVGHDAKGRPIYGEARDDFGVAALGPAERPEVPTGQYKIATNLMANIPPPPKARKPKAKRTVSSAAEASGMLDAPPPPPPPTPVTGGVKRAPSVTEVSSGSSSSEDESEMEEE